MNKTLILGLRGPINSGKDYIAKFLKQEITADVRISKITEPAKQMVATMLGVPYYKVDDTDSKEEVIHTIPDEELEGFLFHNHPEMLLFKDTSPELKEMGYPEFFEENKISRNLTCRQYIISLMEEANNKIGPSFWMNRISLKEGALNIIADVRHCHQVDWILKQGGVVLDINRPFSHRFPQYIDKNWYDLNAYYHGAPNELQKENPELYNLLNGKVDPMSNYIDKTIPLNVNVGRVNLVDGLKTALDTGSNKLWMASEGAIKDLIKTAL